MAFQARGHATARALHAEVTLLEDEEETVWEAFLEEDKVDEGVERHVEETDAVVLSVEVLRVA